MGENFDQIENLKSQNILHSLEFQGEDKNIENIDLKNEFLYKSNIYQNLQNKKYNLSQLVVWFDRLKKKDQNIPKKKLNSLTKFFQIQKLENDMMSFMILSTKNIVLISLENLDGSAKKRGGLERFFLHLAPKKLKKKRQMLGKDSVVLLCV